MLHNCDCLEGLRQLEPDSIDCIVTDPPYGLKLMGKDWDKALPDPEVFRECLRVLKPGGFCFVMSAPRSDLQSRMSLLLEGAGFNIGFTPIYWTYASGFPKAMNISKKIDKRLGKEREKIKRIRPDAKKPGYAVGSFKSGCGGSDKCYDPNPLSDEAKRFDGSYAGFQPKPAVEIIIVAMKPLSERTYLDQVLCNGKGVTWLDDCRIPYQNDADVESAKPGTTPPTKISSVAHRGFNERSVFSPSGSGRFPANLLVSNDTLNNGINFHSRGNKKPETRTVGIFGGFGNKGEVKEGLPYDSGSFSRYFDLDAWWTQKIKELPTPIQKTYPFIITPKASKTEKNKGIETKNHHPTVKPLKLMTYLITLGSQPGDTILDPYTGSGTTLIAAKILQRQYIGYEKEPEYYTIAEHRLKAHQPPSQKKLKI